MRAAAAAVVAATSAMAQLQQVNNFGDTFNTQLSMKIYVPPNPAPSPAIVLAVGTSLHTVLLGILTWRVASPLWRIRRWLLWSDIWLLRANRRLNWSDLDLPIVSQGLQLLGRSYFSEQHPRWRW